MKKCYECGKEMKFLEWRYHPALGKKILVCSNCFKKLEGSMEQYRKFILNEFGNKETKKSIENLIKKLKSQSINKNYI